MSNGSSSAKDARAERERRLAAALKANLKRRKAQQRKAPSGQAARPDEPEGERR